MRVDSVDDRMAKRLQLPSLPSSASGHARLPDGGLVESGNPCPVLQLRDCTTKSVVGRTVRAVSSEDGQSGVKDRAILVGQEGAAVERSKLINDPHLTCDYVPSIDLGLGVACSAASSVYDLPKPRHSLKLARFRWCQSLRVKVSED